MNKPRILLHSMTFMRDFGFVYSLSRVMEKLGCETFVCSNTDYISLPMRLWKPDVVFYVTVGRTEQLMRAFPDSALVLWNAESCRFDTYPPLELEIASHPEKYHRLGRVLLWGKKTRELILEHARKNDWHWINHDLETFRQKFVVVGHPRIDLARFGADTRADKRVRIGIIGLCASVNNGKFSIPEMLLNDKDKDDDFETAEEFAFQIKYYQLMKKLTLDFGTDNYEYSLRPYFLENLGNYDKAPLIKSGILRLDNSIEFTSWLKNQDLIIGAVSTTMYLVAAAEKAYISVDKLLKRPMERIVFAKEYLSGIPDHCPENYEDFKKMVRDSGNNPLTFNSSDILQQQRREFLKPEEDLPTLFLMSQQIIRCAREKSHKTGIPTWLCNKFNNLRTAYAELRGINRQPNNYSHFRKNIIPQADMEFKKTVDNIINSIPRAKLTKLEEVEGNKI